MTDYTAILGIFMLGCGIYCVYAAVMLKTKGIINKNIMLGRDMNPKKCKDKKGYIDSIFPKTLILGIVCTIYGIVDVLNAFFVKITELWYIMLVLLFIVLVWFGVGSSKAAKKYF